jgi:radical SAM protein with 4Fe4S-binding SPASM domain
VAIEQLVPLYREAARYTVKNRFSGRGPLLSLASDIITQIVEKRRSLIYCPAFFEQLSIATDGSVYPCFMFIGDPAFRFGNILADEFPTKESSQLFSRYAAEFGQSSVGTEEWYAPFFGGCIAGDYITNSDMSIRSWTPIYEAMIEECLLAVATQGTLSGAGRSY